MTPFITVTESPKTLFRGKTCHKATLRMLCYQSSYQSTLTRAI